MTNFKRSLLISLSLLLAIWLVQSYAYFFDADLWRNGINPRTVGGLWGIIFTPLLHGSWSHLAANSPPLGIMTMLLFYGYPRAATKSFIGIWILSGFLTWIFARDSIHIGISGVNNGLMFLLFTIGVLRKDHRSIAFAMIVFFLYGGMIWSVFPNDPDISFELHFFGAISGILMAFIFRNADKKLIPKKYQWEDPNQDLDDDLIGDLWKKDENMEESD